MSLNWNYWTPQERAILCFIQNESKILLIRKKRGLGAGKINAPGGRIELGEMPIQAAVRETYEEVQVFPFQLKLAGHLHFQFLNGYSLHCSVFLASGFLGTPTSTEEADPFWVSVSQIPYEEMWEDDRYWLPGILKGKWCRGFFIFNESVMKYKNIQWI